MWFVVLVCFLKGAAVREQLRNICEMDIKLLENSDEALLRVYITMDAFKPNYDISDVEYLTLLDEEDFAVDKKTFLAHAKENIMACGVAAHCKRVARMLSKTDKKTGFKASLWKTAIESALGETFVDPAAAKDDLYKARHEEMVGVKQREVKRCEAAVTHSKAEGKNLEKDQKKLLVETAAADLKKAKNGALVFFRYMEAGFVRKKFEKKGWYSLWTFFFVFDEFHFFCLV